MLSKTRLIISDNPWFRKPYAPARYAMGGNQSLTYTFGHLLLPRCYCSDQDKLDLITNPNIYIQYKPWSYRSQLKRIWHGSRSIFFGVHCVAFYVGYVVVYFVFSVGAICMENLRVQNCAFLHFFSELKIEQLWIKKSII